MYGIYSAEYGKWLVSTESNVIIKVNDYNAANILAEVFNFYENAKTWVATECQL